MKNKIKLYLSYFLRGLLTLSLNGAILQTFLLENGIDDNQLAVLISVFQLFQTATLFAFSAISDKLKGVIKITALSFLLCLPSAVYFAVVAIFPEVSIDLTLLIVLTSLAYIFNGIFGVISIKLQYLVMPIEEFGVFVSIQSLVSGVSGIIFSAIISSLQLVLDFNAVAIWIYLLSSAFSIIITALIMSLKPSHTPPEEAKEKCTQNLLKYKPFTRLAVSDVIRGFGAGVIGLAVTIGYYTDMLNSASASVMAVVTSVSTVGASFLLAILDRRVKYRSIVVTAGIFAFAFMPFMAVFSNSNAFILFYAISYFAVSIINVVIPIIISKTVDHRIVGKYTGARLLLHTLGTSIAGFVCIPLIDMVGVFTTLLIAGATQLIVGLSYFFHLKNEPGAKIRVAEIHDEIENETSE